MSSCVKTFDKDKLKTFHGSLLKKYKSIRSKIRKLKGVRLTPLSVHDDKCIKTKIKNV